MGDRLVAGRLARHCPHPDRGGIPGEERACRAAGGIRCGGRWLALAGGWGPGAFGVIGLGACLAPGFGGTGTLGAFGWPRAVDAGGPVRGRVSEPVAGGSGTAERLGVGAAESIGVRAGGVRVTGPGQVPVGVIFRVALPLAVALRFAVGLRVGIVLVLRVPVGAQHVVVGTVVVGTVVVGTVVVRTVVVRTVVVRTLGPVGGLFLSSLVVVSLVVVSLVTGEL
jgi:hypothetical protein